MKILIVEDNSGVRRLLKRAISDRDTEIWECSDGVDAQVAYADHRPDLVLMDIRMPRMDGLTATRKIREFYPDARVVIVTDYDDDELRAAALGVGACGYTLKQDLANLPQLIFDVFRSPGASSSP